MLPVLNAALISIAFLMFSLGISPTAKGVPEQNRRKARIIIATVSLFLGLVVNL